MDKKRALVLGGGAFAGSYSAGFVSELCRRAGAEYFDAVYGVSVGATIATFFVANQPDVIEDTWRNHVGGKKLFNPWNVFSRKKMLNLNYLIGLFKGNTAHLDVDAVMSSKTELSYPVMDYDTGKIEYRRPGQDDIYDLIWASCSLPFFSGPKEIKGKKYLDAGFLYGGIPLLKEICQKYDEIFVILNTNKSHLPVFRNSFFNKYCRHIIALALKSYSQPLQNVFKNSSYHEEETIRFAKNCPLITLIVPKGKFFLKSTLDTSANNIGNMIDEGKQDAIKFCRELF